MLIYELRINLIFAVRKFSISFVDLHYLISLMKQFFTFLKELIEVIAISLLAVFLIRNFLIQPFFVKGQSMFPDFQNGDYLIIDELTYRFRQPDRGEIIVFKFPLDQSNYFIKRIIGLPKETVEIKNGKIVVFNELNPDGFLLKESYIDEKQNSGSNLKITLTKDEYFVLGDNRSQSYDSRSWGTLNKDLITGIVRLRAWPIKSWTIFNEAPAY